MSAKTVLSTALVLTAFSFGAVRGQSPDNGEKNPLDALPPRTAVANKAPGQTVQMPVQTEPSSWIRGCKYKCCDATGGDGPIEYEVFARLGPSIPLASGTLSNTLQTGIDVGAGGRVLFYDPATTSAWTGELGWTEIWNHAHSTSKPIAINILVPPLGTLVHFGTGGVPGVTVQELRRTYGDFGGGYECYLLGSAHCPEPSFRVGVDGGGRYGTESVMFHEIPHRADTIAGLWASVHADLEMPCCGCCVVVAGVRVEYAYTWSDILQRPNNSDTQDLNVIFNVGVKF